MAKLTEIGSRILEVMRKHPNGISEGEIRAILNIPAEEQANFGRRRRELNATYQIEVRREGNRALYVYKGLRPNAKDTLPIGNKIRAQVLHLARGTCGMCGRTIVDHGVVLHIDHKLPRDLGGKTELENLWALCSTCNEGKKNHFATLGTPAMRTAMTHKSVHIRLGEALKAAKGKPVSAETLRFIADQDDWKKRVRELRYLGWEIETHNAKNENGRVISFYTLIKHRPWPDDPTFEIRKYERDRALQNRKR